MAACEACGGPLVSVAEHDGERSFTLYECGDCGRSGGRASGAGLPDRAWGVVGERLVADGGQPGGIVDQFSERLTGALIRWGLIKHPYGRDYVKEHYTLTGKWRGGTE